MAEAAGMIDEAADWLALLTFAGWALAFAAGTVALWRRGG
jgi:hypothetical protein